jgi:hypothetical protein
MRTVTVTPSAGVCFSCAHTQHKSATILQHKQASHHCVIISMTLILASLDIIQLCARGERDCNIGGRQRRHSDTPAKKNTRYKPSSPRPLSRHSWMAS